MTANPPKARRICALLAPLMQLQFGAYHGHGGEAYRFSVMRAGLNMIGAEIGDPEPPMLPLSTPDHERLAAILPTLGYEPRETTTHASRPV